MDKKSWWVDFRFNHTRIRKRSPENSRAGALAYEATLRKKLGNGESIDKPQAATQEQTFGQFAEEWLTNYAEPNNKPAEQMNKRNAMRKSFIPRLGKLSVEAVTAYHIEQCKAALLKSGLSPKTINNHLTILNTCLKTAYEWLNLPGTPPKIKKLKAPPPVTDYLSPAEIDLLLGSATGLVRDLIIVAYHTGMRQGEIEGLQWGSVDWQNRSITVRHSRDSCTKALGTTKSNRERYIPMDADVYSTLFNRKKATGYVFTHEDGRPFLDNRYTRQKLQDLCKKVGLRKIGWHTFRHTFASHLVMRSVPLNTVQALLGHSDIKTTMRYAHLAPSTMRQAIDMLNPRVALDQDFGQPVVSAWVANLAGHEAQKAEVPQNRAVTE